MEKAGTGNSDQLSQNSEYSGEIPGEYSSRDSDHLSSSDKTEDQKTCAELYTALDDKNRAIDILKRRLTNQQIQLTYYLHKNLTAEAVLEYSNQCLPHLIVDNAQLTMAMYKFVRDTGGKSRLSHLHDRLNEYNRRAHKALMYQEKLIRYGMTFEDKCQTGGNVLDLEEIPFDVGQGEICNELRFSKKAFRLAHLDLCSKLMSVTLQVRRELERFRLCAESVVQLEDERNALVDRVFSLPPDQRCGGMQLVMLEYDRRAKCHELRDPAHSQDQPASRTSISTDTTVDIGQQTTPSSSATVVRSSSPGHRLEQVLRDMEAEAIQLLLLSEKQKSEFAASLAETRRENELLKERLTASEDAESDERVLELQERCLAFEQDLEDMKRHLEDKQREKEGELERMAVELQVKAVTENDLEQGIKQLTSEIVTLKTERDSLRRQIEEDRKGKVEVNKTTKTGKLSRQETHAQDVKELTELVITQETEIKSLLSILSGLGLNVSEKELSITSEHESTTRIRKPGNTSRNNSTHAIKSTRPPYVTSPEDASFDSGVGSPPPSKFLDEISSTPHQDTCSMFYKTTDEFFGAMPTLDESRNDTTVTDFDFLESKSQDGNRESPRTECCSDDDQKLSYGSEKHPGSYYTSRSRKRHYESSENKARLASTSLRVEAYDKNGKSESMHAFLETSTPVEGLLEMDNSSKLRLRLQCTSPSRDYTEAVTDEPNRRSDNSARHNAGDHTRAKDTTACPSRKLSRDERLFLSKQLSKIKSELDATETGSCCRKNIVNNLNDIYSHLFGGKPPRVMTPQSENGQSSS